MVINSTVHLLRLLSSESLRSINLFGCDSNDYSQSSVTTFRTSLSPDFLAAVAADVLSFNNDTFVLRGAFQRCCFDRENSYHLINIGVILCTISSKKIFQETWIYFSSST